MQIYRAPRCAFCGAASTFSAERADDLEMGETWTCQECGRQAGGWDGEIAERLDVRADMPWAAPDSLY